jgi:peroxiredoxin
MSVPPHGVSRRASRALMALACALAVGACGGDPPPASTPASQATRSTDVQSSVPAVLTFSSDIVGGGHFDGASLAGKPAVLWFWAAWCPRCQAKASDVGMLQAEFAGTVTFVGVAGLGSGDDGMTRFVAQHSLGGFTHLADDDGTVWRHFGVAEQEVFVVIDKAGTVVYTGPMTTGDLRERLAGLG